MNAMSTTILHPAARTRSHLLLLIQFCLALMLLSPLAGWTQQCSATSFGVDFGNVDGNASASAVGTLPYNCQANASNTYYQVCLFIPEGNIPATSGINPRRMTDYNGHSIAYNLYSDPGHTQIIGPPPSGGGYPVYAWSFMVPGGWTSPLRTVSVYGLIPPLPAGTFAGAYQAQFSNVTMQYAWSNTAMPADCFTPTGANSGAQAVIVGYNGTNAKVSSSCRISLGNVADLDFGSTATLASAQTSSTSISLSCPGSTTWKLGLNNGLNADGTQRRMKKSDGSNHYIPYELYRDSNRSQRWGNDTAGGSDTVNGAGSAQTNPTVITVYGLVPAQPQPDAGTYSDTITVRLEY